MSVSQDEIMARVRAEVQEQQLQELVQTLSEKCFEKCVRPSSALSTSEQACISKCSDRYLNAMVLVFQAVSRKAEQSGQI